MPKIKMKSKKIMKKYQNDLNDSKKNLELIKNNKKRKRKIRNGRKSKTKRNIRKKRIRKF